VSSRLETAKAIFKAYVDKDRAAVERLITEDFRFTSPLDNALQREAYLRICWPNSKTTKRFDFQRMVESGGDQVFVTYEADTTTGKRFRNTEVLTIRDGRISAVEVYFGWNVPHEVPAGDHRDPV
jgi:ketosteroid isomerase-like protein